MENDHVYKKIEITGTSTISSDAAVQNAIVKASTSVAHLRWFEVIDSRGSIADGKIERWQVTLKIGFTMN